MAIFDKREHPILKKEYNRGFKAGFAEGEEAGRLQKIPAYENEIEFLKTVIRGLTKEKK